MRRIQFRLTVFDRVDRGRLIEHLTDALLVAMGSAIVAHPDGDVRAAVLPASKGCFGAGLVYGGGYIQNAEKLPAANNGDMDRK